MRTSLLLVFSVFLFSGAANAQQSNSSGTSQWPANPPVGIGTQLNGGPLDALHIHHDPTPGSPTMNSILRLSEGTATSSAAFGVLGLTPSGGLSSYSSLSQGFDLILHEHHAGDLILTNWEQNATTGGAIRMSTTGDMTQRPNGFPPTTHDLERVTILPNGNVGVDLPPDSASGLGLPLDQVQIGGGSAIVPGRTAVVPGLTIYGGSRFEGMPLPDPNPGTYPYDWRYISLNHYVDHGTASGDRSHRISPTSMAQIGLSDERGGMLDLFCSPYDSTMGGDSAMSDFSGGLQLHMIGEEGLSLWSDETKHGNGDYHHLFDIFRPGVTPWPLTRNTNGLFIHHTPVLISSDSTSTPNIDFTNLANVHPDIGDGYTWVLAVNGPALFKEIFVNTNDWPDYVFDPNYRLRSIEEFGSYIHSEHHLPQIPSAEHMQGGFNVGKAQEALTRQVEQMALYIVQLNQQVKELKEEVEALKGGVTR